MFPFQIWLTGRQLAAKSPQTRLNAVQKLRQRGSVPVLLILARVLEDEDPQVRAEARAALVEGLHDAAEPVQVELVQTLKRGGVAAAREGLVAALEAGAASARWQAAQALRALGWEARDPAEELAFHIAVGDLERASEMGPAAIGPLSQVLREGSYQHRVTAAELLGQFASPEVLPPLIAALKDPDAIVRRAAAGALSRVNRQEAVEALIGSLRDGEAKVRTAAAGALGAMKDPQSVEPLITLLSDKDWEVRAAALESLGRLHDPRALGPVVARLGDEDTEVRQHAAESLGELGDESAIGQLLPLALDEHAGVRQAALRGLNRITRDWQHSAHARSLVPDLQTALQHKDTGVQQTATQLLKRITGMTPLELAEASQRATTEQRHRAAVQVLAGLLNHGSGEVRLASAQALGRIALPPCVDALRQAVNDPNPWVQAATRSLLDTLTRRSKA